MGWLRLAVALHSLGAKVDLIDCMDRFDPLLQSRPTRKHRLNPFGAGHYPKEVIPKPPQLEFVPRRYHRFGMTPAQLQEKLQKTPRPDVVLTGCLLTYWYPGVIETIQTVRSLWPEVPVGVAGVYARLCPDHAGEVSGADFVDRGPALSPLLKWISDKTGLDKNFAETLKLQQVVKPEYPLLSNKKALPLATSTGCTFRCTYCASHRLSPEFVQFPLEHIIPMMLDCREKYGATDWAFYDDALLVNSDNHFKPLFRKLLSHNPGFRFHAPNALHCRYIDREIAQLMKASGFVTVRLGLEFSQSTLQYSTGGKTGWEEYVSAMEHLRQAGFTPKNLGAYVMIGYPGLPLEQTRETARRVIEQGSPVRLTRFSPVPGTADFGLDFSAWRFHPAEDPLYQNCSLAPYRDKQIPAEKFLALQNEIDQWNQNLTSLREPPA